MRVELRRPLKGEARAAYKALEKYAGDYSRLTDLARMTFECATISTALAILNFIRDHIDWTITRVKNRLDLAYDPSSTGGYRDMLINAVHKDLHHYVEIQVTLKCLLTIKKNGGGESFAAHFSRDPPTPRSALLQLQRWEAFR